MQSMEILAWMEGDVTGVAPENMSSGEQEGGGSLPAAMLEHFAARLGAGGDKLFAQ